MLSQGTSTFLLCFAGFWLVWAFIITTCCFCSFVRRRLKRESEERLREQCLRDLHPPPPHLSPPHREPCPLQFCPPTVHRLSLSLSSPPPVTPGPLPHPLPHPLPQANWVTMPDVELSGGRPPCYEEALLMDDPPPPYSEVLLTEPLGGPPPPRTTHVLPLVPHDPYPSPMPPSSDTSKPPLPPPSPGGGPRLVVVGSPERGGHYDSLVPLPSLHHGSNHRDSLGRLLASMDISRHHQHHLHHQHHQDRDPLSFLSSTLHSTIPHLQDGGRTQRDQLALRAGGQGKQVMQGLRGLEPGCGLPTAFPLLGRSTAV